LFRRQRPKKTTTYELSNHGDVSARGESLHEGLGAGLGDSTEVVDEVSLGHCESKERSVSLASSEEKGQLRTSDTRVADGEGSVGLVGGDADEEVLLRVELARVGEGGVADLVEGIGRVGDKLTKEDLLQRGRNRVSKLKVRGGRGGGQSPPLLVSRGSLNEPCSSRKCL
jgi:hypothetical protein